MFVKPVIILITIKIIIDLNDFKWHEMALKTHPNLQFVNPFIYYLQTLRHSLKYQYIYCENSFQLMARLKSASNGLT